MNIVEKAKEKIGDITTLKKDDIQLQRERMRERTDPEALRASPELDRRGSETGQEGVPNEGWDDQWDTQLSPTQPGSESRQDDELRILLPHLEHKVKRLSAALDAKTRQVSQLRLELDEAQRDKQVLKRHAVEAAALKETVISLQRQLDDVTAMLNVPAGFGQDELQRVCKALTVTETRLAFAEAELATQAREKGVLEAQLKSEMRSVETTQQELREREEQLLILEEKIARLEACGTAQLVRELRATIDERDKRLVQREDQWLKETRTLELDWGKERMALQRELHRANHELQQLQSRPLVRPASAGALPFGLFSACAFLVLGSVAVWALLRYFGPTRLCPTAPHKAIAIAVNATAS
eukprot:TRINITY_DN22274_c0_g1_i1.p1 TRINITY_DN22274_c0_g1~~TRINITY_DN22274_c0_g1_i1.p1  ORF type:complete len:356 (-),score=82.75 TRINITY_DN22274_c0_g1_i1:1-1068(-)